MGHLRHGGASQNKPERWTNLSKSLPIQGVFQGPEGWNGREVRFSTGEQEGRHQRPAYPRPLLPYEHMCHRGDRSWRRSDSLKQIAKPGRQIQGRGQRQMVFSATSLVQDEKQWRWKWEKEGGLKLNGKRCLSAQLSKPGCHGFWTPASKGACLSSLPDRWAAESSEAPPVGGLLATGPRQGGTAVHWGHSLNPRVPCCS